MFLKFQHEAGVLAGGSGAAKPLQGPLGSQVPLHAVAAKVLFTGGGLHISKAS